MISFIIIGQNEGWKLTKCFESIFKTIEFNHLNNYEVIYIDSNSTDDSIVRAKKFTSIKVFKLTGACNAAIARNVGAKESKGDVLFFIDGDMQINHEFLKLVYDEINGLKYGFVSGQFIDIETDENGQVLSKSFYHAELKGKDKKYFTVGGIFLIRRRLWFLVKGMKPKFKRSQDLDFGLRLARQSVFLVRKKHVICNHYTIPYSNKKRQWQMLLNKSDFYGKSVLYRENVCNKYMYALLLRNDYTLVILISSFIASLVFNNMLFLGLYLLSILFRSIMKSKGFVQKIAHNIFYYFFRDMGIIYSFIFFFPKDVNENSITFQKIL